MCLSTYLHNCYKPHKATQDSHHKKTGQVLACYGEFPCFGPQSSHCLRLMVFLTFKIFSWGLNEETEYLSASTAKIHVHLNNNIYIHERYSLCSPPLSSCRANKKVAKSCVITNWRVICPTGHILTPSATFKARVTSIRSIINLQF